LKNTIDVPNVEKWRRESDNINQMITDTTNYITQCY
jgi:hypothetical protein